MHLDADGYLVRVERARRSRRESVRAWHVTSSTNRESIREHGLDWRRMGAARGIAGSQTPEQEGCFLAFDMFTVDWFLRFDATTLPLDVWEVADVYVSSTLESPEGYQYLPGVIEPQRLRLVRTDVWPDPQAWHRR